MNRKNIKIGTQLKIGFVTILLLVVILGVVSYFQAAQIHLQTESMHDHPMKVRMAIGTLKSDIYAIHRDMKDVFLSNDENDISRNITQIDKWVLNVFEQIDTLYENYLGPKTDIDSFKIEFVVWNAIRDETIRLLRSGNIAEAVNRTKTFGVGGKQVEIILATLKKIDDFSMSKAEAIFLSSKTLKETLNIQLIILVGVILLIAIIINIILIRNIHKPINELARASRQFHEGDMNARSSYILRNEFGMLSDSFNAMVEKIQINKSLDEKVASLAALMLSEYDAKKFFQATINALASHTGSQMAAIYLLSNDKKSYDHFESTGMDHNARQSFAADNFEGEFGLTLSSRKVQHIKNIPEDTRFVFYTVSGKFIPREIITLPIIANNEIVAVISLVSINSYSQQSILLIDRILVTLCTRVEGILAFHRIKKILEKLEIQNRELEAQKTELAAQSAELTEQNTELEVQKKQLSQASLLKTNFLSNMSHELRTPLNSVIALSNVLSRRLAKIIPTEEYSYLEVIERNGRNLLALINDILDISRIEAGKEEIEIAVFDVGNLISEVISMIYPQAQQKNIELIYADAGIVVSALSDVDKFRHILQNLVGNAVKFTEKGKVEVRASQNRNNIEITVSDTGIGISNEQLPIIFDEFRQADGSTSRRFGGTGLGLAIAKKYANILGGTISVKSVPGKGSDFTLILPLQYAFENRVEEIKSNNIFSYSIKRPVVLPVTDSAARTILLVEDSEPAIIQIKDFLEESGYKILVARGGEEALEIISHTIPDAMILDLMMPGIDGFEVLRTLREAEPTANIPVLILTAKHITKEELKFLKRNNIHQLIQKGDVKRKELLDAIASMAPSTLQEMTFQRNANKIISGKPVVLVVEDNPDNMITAKAILADEFTVLEAVNGNEAISMAKLNVPNLILMDIELPEVDGIQAFKTIRNDPELQHIPVIALTASAMITDREAILAHGFDAYIAKPIDENVFFKTINDTLYGKSQN